MLRKPTAVDAVVAAALLVLGQVEVYVWYTGDHVAAAHLVWLLFAVAALWLSQYPIAFAAVGVVIVLGVVPAFRLSPEYSALIALGISLWLFGLGFYAPDFRSAVVRGAIGVAVTFAVFVAIDLGDFGTGNKSALQWGRTLAAIVIAAAAGVALRDRTAALTDARRRLAALPPVATAVEQAVAQMRRRIARELHDVVAVCLAKLRTLVETAIRSNEHGNVAAAREAIEGARRASREAMDELRRTLVLLREPEDRSETPVSAIEKPDPTQGGWAASPVGRLIRRHGIVLVLAVSGVVYAVAAERSDPQLGEVAFLWRVVGALALAAVFIPRRRLPLFTLAGTMAVVAFRSLVIGDLYPFDLPLWIAAFVGGAYIRNTFVSVVATTALLVGEMAVVIEIEPWVPAGAAISFNVILAAAWVFGFLGRKRLAEADELDRLAREISERQAARVRLAEEESKRAVARELHDLVGHGLTTITLQCAAAETLTDADTARRGEALTIVRKVAGQVDGELTQLLEVLDDGRVEPGFDPDSPPLAALGPAIRRWFPNGDISYRPVGDLDSVPVGPAAAICRIVQESVVNAAKHGGSGPVEVTIERTARSIQVAVHNPLPFKPRPAQATGTGFGTVGIRERAQAFDGTVRIGPDTDRRWEVYVSLPLSPARTSPLS